MSVWERLGRTGTFSTANERDEGVKKTMISFNFQF